MPHRGDAARRASGLIRGMLDRVIALEQQVSSQEALPNVVIRTVEQGDATDTVSISTTASGDMQYDVDSYDSARYQ